MAIRLESEIGGKVVPLWHEIVWMRPDDRDKHKIRVCRVWSLCMDVSNAAPIRIIADHGESYFEVQNALENAGFKKVTTVVLPPKPVVKPEKDMTPEEIAEL